MSATDEVAAPRSRARKALGSLVTPSCYLGPLASRRSAPAPSRTRHTIRSPRAVQAKADGEHESECSPSCISERSADGNARLGRPRLDTQSGRRQGGSGEGAVEHVSECSPTCMSERRSQPTPAWAARVAARPVAAAAVQAKAAGEHLSERTPRCVSEGRSRPTPAWAAPVATARRPR
jgi:hypothetical protein